MRPAAHSPSWRPSQLPAPTASQVERTTPRRSTQPRPQQQRINEQPRPQQQRINKQPPHSAQGKHRTVRFKTRVSKWFISQPWIIETGVRREAHTKELAVGVASAGNEGGLDPTGRSEGRKEAVRFRTHFISVTFRLDCEGKSPPFLPGPYSSQSIETTSSNSSLSLLQLPPCCTNCLYCCCC